MAKPITISKDAFINAAMDIIEKSGYLKSLQMSLANTDLFLAENIITNIVRDTLKKHAARLNKGIFSSGFTADIQEELIQEYAMKKEIVVPAGNDARNKEKKLVPINAATTQKIYNQFTYIFSQSVNTFLINILIYLKRILEVYTRLKKSENSANQNTSYSFDEISNIFIISIILSHKNQEDNPYHYTALANIFDMSAANLFALENRFFYLLNNAGKFYISTSHVLALKFTYFREIANFYEPLSKEEEDNLVNTPSDYNDWSAQNITLSLLKKRNEIADILTARSKISSALEQQITEFNKFPVTFEDISAFLIEDFYPQDFTLNVKMFFECLYERFQALALIAANQTSKQQMIKDGKILYSTFKSTIREMENQPLVKHDPTLQLFFQEMLKLYPALKACLQQFNDGSNDFLLNKSARTVDDLGNSETNDKSSHCHSEPVLARPLETYSYDIYAPSSERPRAVKLPFLPLRQALETPPPILTTATPLHGKNGAGDNQQPVVINTPAQVAALQN